MASTSTVRSQELKQKIRSIREKMIILNKIEKSHIENAKSDVDARNRKENIIHQRNFLLDWYLYYNKQWLMLNRHKLITSFK